MRSSFSNYACLLLLTLSGVAAQPPAGGAQGERPVVDLSGEWEFKLDPRDVGRAERWFERSGPYERTIQVPGAWNAQGVAFRSEEQLRLYEAQRRDEQKPLSELGLLGAQRESDRLYNVYPGPGWYHKKVKIPAEWEGRVPWLIFNGVHREAEVWVDGRPAGAHHSYLTPFYIDLSRHAKTGEIIDVVVRVDARRRKEFDPLIGCLDTLDFLYVAWGGLNGTVRLEATEAARLDDVFVIPHPGTATAEIRFGIKGARSSELGVEADVIDADGAAVASVKAGVAADATETVLLARLPEPRLWSPKAPYRYTARIRLLSGDAIVDARSIRFGMREFKVSDGKFLLNGKPIFLRGYGDDGIFPNTICPPADKGEFRRRLSLAHEYGFNYVRCHSWTPPEEYLEAADELGMMLQPEFPLAYSWDLPTTVDAKRRVLEEWEASIRLNRNHPSIVAWCMGNEHFDSFDLAPEMYRTAKRLDPTRPVIDSDGCGFGHQGRVTLDFLVVAFGESDSIGFQDGKYDIPAGVTKPVVAHEMGYYATLPDLNQIELFRNGLRPYWLLETRDLAERNGGIASYPDWLASSYRLQATSLKTNLEAARRSGLSGTSVWLFQDYPNCAEGIVDMFFRPKGVSPEEFRTYNAPTVLLLDAPRRNWGSGERAEINFAVSRFEDQPSDTATLHWQLRSGRETLASGVQEHLKINAEGVQKLPAIKLEMPRRARADRLTLSAKLVDANGQTENSWSLWVFPTDVSATDSRQIHSREFDALLALYPGTLRDTPASTPADTHLLVTTVFDRHTSDYLKAGGRVILLKPDSTFTVEATNFRLSSWDGGGPSGTSFDASHPAFRAMPSDGWCDLQYYFLMQGSKTIQLGSLPAKIRPLVRCIDRPSRLADRAYLFEATMGRGKLLVSGFNFEQALAMKDPGAIFFFDQLVRYALGPDFAPDTSLPEEMLKNEAIK